MLALAVVLAYFFVPSFGALLDQLGALKSRWGYGYSAIATAVFGGLLPFLVLRATGQIQGRSQLSTLVFLVAFWTWKGVEVDAFYRLQALLFGEGADAATILKKTIVDQLGYNSLWAAPTQTIFFLWKDSGFSLRRVRERLSVAPLWYQVLTVLLSGWVVWVPTVAIVYSLPSVLQVPLFNLVLCFWCLLLSFISRESNSLRPEARAA